MVGYITRMEDMEHTIYMGICMELVYIIDIIYKIKKY